MTYSFFFFPFNTGTLRLSEPGDAQAGTAEAEGPGRRVGKSACFGPMRSGIHTLLVYKGYLESSRAVFPKVS